MPTTTNYGWTTPADTDLVKDGAAAIRTLGSSIDTTTKALNAGTTNGDLDYFTTGTTKARLAIGTNGQVLTSNGTIPTWATPAGGGGFTSIATGSLSSTTTTISSISQSYRHLYLLIRGAQVNTGALPCFRLNGDASSLYSNFRITLDSTVLNLGGSLSFIRASGSNIPTSANNRAMVLQIENYTQTNQIKPISARVAADTSTGDSCTMVFSNYNSTAAITSIGITTDTGTPTFSAGTYTLFGVN
jgi:hypothetical protein